MTVPGTVPSGEPASFGDPAGRSRGRIAWKRADHGLAAAAVLMMMACHAAPSAAAVVLADDFETEITDLSVAAPGELQNFDVLDGYNGRVRGTNEPSFCAGRPGTCLFTFSTTNDTSFANSAAIRSRAVFSVRSGQAVSIGWDWAKISANPGVGGVSFEFLQPVDVGDVTFGGFGFGDFQSAPSLGFSTADILIGEYRRYSAGFVAGTAGSFTLLFSNSAGISLDNVTLWVAQVPEPSSWLMMALGFGLAGTAMRKHRARVTA